MTRIEMSALDQENFDVIIIGAGINGASSAQHLAAAGYRVLLVDKGDFGSGSSSRSTRMMHCGLRYFETPRPILDFALAPGKLAVALRMAKASMEMRGELVRDSPKRMRAIRLMFPIFKGGPYKAWQLDLAFKILGRFGPRDVPLDYERVPADRARSLPFIDELRNSEQLHSVGIFTEYMFDWPERVLIDAVLDAERLGAVVRNYTRASLGKRDSQGIWSVGLCSGDGPEITATVRASVVLNMAGIWIDKINQSAVPDAKRLIFGTKGAHLVVKLPDAWRDHGIATTNSVGEPHYILPSNGGYHHIGPTETPYDGDLEKISLSSEDRTFLLNETDHVFPGLQLSENDIVYSWAGVRSLGFDSHYPKGKRSVELHELSTSDLPGVHAMTAGPIMTHRSAGRDVVKSVQKVLAPTRSPQTPDYSPRDFPSNLNSPPLVVDDPSVRLSDLAHAATAEHGSNLSDILISRTGIVYRHQLSDEEIRRAADAVSVHLGWSRDEAMQQAASFKELLKTTYEMV